MAIYDENGVPVLKLSPSSQEFVDGKHAAAVEALEQNARAVVGVDPGIAQPVEDGEAPVAEDPAIQAQYADLSKHLLTGDAVVIHNKAPAHAITKTAGGGAILDPEADNRTFVSIGASTLDEALKECIAAFEVHVYENDRVNRPDWVASTNGDLARLLAEHYNGGKADGPCQPRPLSEVL